MNDALLRTQHWAGRIHTPFVKGKRYVFLLPTAYDWGWLVCIMKGA
jgi:hypothetical protein